MAMEVSASLGIPVTHLDRLRCDDTFDLVDPAVYRRRHDEVLRQDRWIIEGIPRYPMDSPTAAQRLQQCEAVVYIDRPPLVTLWRSWRRSSGHAAIDTAIPNNARYGFNTHSVKRTLIFYFFMRPAILKELHALRKQGKQVHIVRDDAQVAVAMAVLTGDPG